MLGSKNSELTRKYGLSSLAVSTFSLASSRWRVANSSSPTATHSSASADGDPVREAHQPRRPGQVEQQPEQQRERDVEEADVLDRGLDVGRVDRLHRVEDDHAGEHALEAADARVARLGLARAARAPRAPARPRRSPRTAAAAGSPCRRRCRAGCATGSVANAQHQHQRGPAAEQPGAQRPARRAPAATAAPASARRPSSASVTSSPTTVTSARPAARARPASRAPAAGRRRARARGRRRAWPPARRSPARPERPRAASFAAKRTRRRGASVRPAVKRLLAPAAIVLAVAVALRVVLARDGISTTTPATRCCGRATSLRGLHAGLRGAVRARRRTRCRPRGARWRCRSAT